MVLAAAGLLAVACHESGILLSLAFAPLCPVGAVRTPATSLLVDSRQGTLFAVGAGQVSFDFGVIARIVSVHSLELLLCSLLDSSASDLAELVLLEGLVDSLLQVVVGLDGGCLCSLILLASVLSSEGSLSLSDNISLLLLLDLGLLHISDSSIVR